MYYSRIGRMKLTSQRIETAHFDSAFVQYTTSKERGRVKTQDFYYNPSNGTVNVNYDGALSIATKDIYGKVISHEIGDGQRDSMMRRVIVEAVPFLEDQSVGMDQALALYDYNVLGNDYPKMYITLRSNAYTMIPSSYQKTIDLIGLNMQPRSTFPGVNPWRSILQTPTTDTNASYQMDVYDETINPQGDVMNAHESFVLLAPLQNKFRRCKFKYQCKFTVIIRAFTLEYQQVGRRFG